MRQRPDDPDLHLALGFGAAGLGLKDEAIREGRKATALMSVTRDNYSGPGYLTWLAQLYLRVGENDQAIDTLREVLAVPSGGVADVASICSDSIRSGIRCAKIRAFRN